MAGIRNVVVVLAVILLTVYALSVRDYLAAQQQQQQQQRTGDGTQQQRQQQQRSRAVSLASCNSTRLDFSRVHRISWNPRAYHYKGFLTDEECDHWVAKAYVVAARSLAALPHRRWCCGSFEPRAASRWACSAPRSPRSTPTRCRRCARARASSCRARSTHCWPRSRSASRVGLDCRSSTVRPSTFCSTRSTSSTSRTTTRSIRRSPAWTATSERVRQRFARCTSLVARSLAALV